MWCFDAVSRPLWYSFQALKSDCPRVLLPMLWIYFFVKHNFLKSDVIFSSLEEFLWFTTTSLAILVRIKFMEAAVYRSSIKLDDMAEGLDSCKSKNCGKHFPVTFLWILVSGSNKLSSCILFFLIEYCIFRFISHAWFYPFFCSVISSFLVLWFFLWIWSNQMV